MNITIRAFIILCLWLLAGCSISGSDSPTLGGVLSREQQDSLEGSWQFAGYIIDRDPDSGALLFVWDTDPQLMDQQTVEQILEQASPHASWIGVRNVSHTDRIPIGQKVALNMSGPMETSYPAHTGMSAIQVVQPEEKITVNPSAAPKQP